MAFYTQTNGIGPGSFGGGQAGGGANVMQRFSDPGELANAAGSWQQAQAIPQQTAIAQGQLKLGQQTEADKMSRFNSVYGLLGGMAGHMNNGFATAGGQNGTPPPISTGPVLNSQQIQQQVNQSHAANDQSTQSQTQATNNSLAGRGFGSNSPLSQALGQAAQGQNMATNTANETNTRLNAAQQNAGHLLNTQQALSNQWATGNQLDIQRRAPVFAQQNALIAALGGLV